MIRARRLTTIAKWINENRPELWSNCMKWRVSTNRKPAGSRHITHVGKGYSGYKIWVYAKDVPRPIFEFDNCDPYSTNDVAERWLAEYLVNHKPKRKRAR